jgi:hypothetical protein
MAPGWLIEKSVRSDLPRGWREQDRFEPRADAV